MPGWILGVALLVGFLLLAIGLTRETYKQAKKGRTLVALVLIVPTIYAVGVVTQLIPMPNESWRILIALSVAILAFALGIIKRKDEKAKADSPEGTDPG